MGVNSLGRVGLDTFGNGSSDSCFPLARSDR